MLRTRPLQLPLGGGTLYTLSCQQAALSHGGHIARLLLSGDSGFQLAAKLKLGVLGELHRLVRHTRWSDHRAVLDARVLGAALVCWQLTAREDVAGPVQQAAQMYLVSALH